MKSLVDRKSNCYGIHWLLCKLTGCSAKPVVAMEKLRLLWKVSVAMKKQWVLWKSLVARKSQWLLWKSLVAMQIHWLLCKASGRYGEVTAVVESQQSL
jgi:hypothetical protein